MFVAKNLRPGCPGCGSRDDGVGHLFALNMGLFFRVPRCACCLTFDAAAMANKANRLITASARQAQYPFSFEF